MQFSPVMVWLILQKSEVVPELCQVTNLHRLIAASDIFAVFELTRTSITVALQPPTNRTRINLCSGVPFAIPTWHGIEVNKSREYLRGFTESKFPLFFFIRPGKLDSQFIYTFAPRYTLSSNSRKQHPSQRGCGLWEYNVKFPKLVIVCGQSACIFKFSKLVIVCGQSACMHVNT